MRQSPLYAAHWRLSEATLEILLPWVMLQIHSENTLQSFLSPFCLDDLACAALCYGICYKFSISSTQYFLLEFCFWSYLFSVNAFDRFLARTVVCWDRSNFCTKYLQFSNGELCTFSWPNSMYAGEYISLISYSTGHFNADDLIYFFYSFCLLIACLSHKGRSLCCWALLPSSL